MFNSPGPSALRELSLAVVGLEYPNADGSDRRFEAELCPPGERVDLVPEPKNPVDPRAVAVISARGVQIGYLTAARCGWIGGRIAAGEDFQALFQELRGSVAVIRVRFGGGAPALPTRDRPMRDAEVEFYADPDGPEWGA